MLNLPSDTSFEGIVRRTRMRVKTTRSDRGWGHRGGGCRRITVAYSGSALRAAGSGETTARSEARIAWIVEATARSEVRSPRKGETTRPSHERSPRRGQDDGKKSRAVAKDCVGVVSVYRDVVSECRDDRKKRSAVAKVRVGDVSDCRDVVLVCRDCTVGMPRRRLGVPRRALGAARRRVGGPRRRLGGADVAVGAPSRRLVIRRRRVGARGRRLGEPLDGSSVKAHGFVMEVLSPVFDLGVLTMKFSRHKS